MTTATVTTYEQALEVQSRLLRRAMLRPAQTHAIALTEERSEFGSVWVRCTCGHWTSFRVDDAERGERLYARHVLETLRDTLAVAA